MFHKKLDYFIISTLTAFTWLSVSHWGATGAKILFFFQYAVLVIFLSPCLLSASIHALYKREITTAFAYLSGMGFGLLVWTLLFMLNQQ